MTLKKEIIILGDVEMGGGTITDDFISDKTLSELISELSRRKHPVDLIFNGDTFDFLKCPYREKDFVIYPRHISQEVALNKLDQIHRAHKSVFTALSKFINNPQNNLHFLIGNHDPELMFPEVQKELRNLLKHHSQINFSLKYNSHGVYVEHGMQYDVLNRLNLKKRYVRYKGKNILNIPWVNSMLVSKFMSIKEDHPFMERIAQRPKMLRFHGKVLKKLTIKGIDYFFKTFLYHPWRYIYDPTYSWPKGLIKEFYTRVKNANWDVDEVINGFKKKKRKSLKLNQVYVLGHIHNKYLEEKDGIAIIRPGSWRDEYDLEDDGKLIPRVKRYVQVLIGNLGKQYQLIELPIRREIFNFQDAVKDEMKYIRLAAKEEDYKLQNDLLLTHD